MDKTKQSVNCPNCGVDIDVNEILYHQLSEELQQQFNDDLAKERRKFAEQAETLKAERKDLEQRAEALDEQVASSVKAGLQREREKLEAKLKAQLAEEQAERLSDLQKELSEKTEQVKALNKSRAEVERLKREKDELRDTIELEAQKRLSRQLDEERAKIRKLEEERATMAISEKDIVIKQLSEQLKDAQKKAEQGSTQLQGEAQELVIEEWLKSQFPLDGIDEIKSGATGADTLQTVNTHARQNCGSIYYESKRTKHFQPAWIEKFKADIRDKGANVGVLVTEVMPSGLDRMGLVDGVWVCTFDEFKGLSTVLRESVIQLSHAIATQENKGDKMEMLYDFLTGNEFQQQIEAIVEGFTQMHSELESEKRSMQGLWKRREKQIQKVLLNTNHMYNSVRGIAGSAVKPVAQLELAEPDEDD
ncbi:MAG: DUF2130 domain-containing protein [Pseudomonadota bacterium]